MQGIAYKRRGPRIETDPIILFFERDLYFFFNSPLIGHGFGHGSSTGSSLVAGETKPLCNGILF